MVDASIIMVENAHKKLEEWEHAAGGNRVDVIIEAAKEVGPRSSSPAGHHGRFLPVFTLQAQAGRLFKPLPIPRPLPCSSPPSRRHADAGPDDPVHPGKIRSEEENPVSRVLHRIYERRGACSAV